MCHTLLDRAPFCQPCLLLCFSDGGQVVGFVYQVLKERGSWSRGPRPWPHNVVGFVYQVVKERGSGSRGPRPWLHNTTRVSLSPLWPIQPQELRRGGNWPLCHSAGQSAGHWPTWPGLRVCNAITLWCMHKWGRAIASVRI